MWAAKRVKKDVDATELTDTYAKQMINDAKPTIMP